MDRLEVCHISGAANARSESTLSCAVGAIWSKNSSSTKRARLGKVLLLWRRLSHHPSSLPNFLTGLNVVDGTTPLQQQHDSPFSKSRMLCSRNKNIRERLPVGSSLPRPLSRFYTPPLGPMWSAFRTVWPDWAILQVLGNKLPHKYSPNILVPFGVISNNVTIMLKVCGYFLGYFGRN